jgi:hypothetical protein
VTVVHDGFEYFYLTLDDELPVTFAVAIVGYILCAACGGAWQAAEMHDLTNPEYARDAVQTSTQYRALHHAKTCNRKAT